ncbi:MAG: hypothetical protein NC081_00670 [Roseburia sp.]|nr:hypothetical protein [Roseburia sp.]
MTNLYEEGTNINDIGYFNMVEADIRMALDSFAAEYTNTRFGVTTREDTYYIIPAPGGTGEDMYYIGVKAADYETMDYNKIVEATHAYLRGESGALGKYSLHRIGCLKKMRIKQYEYFREWFEEAEWFETEEELDKYVLPLCLEPGVGDIATKGLLFGAALLTLGLFILLSDVIARRKRKKRQKEFLRERAQKQKIITIDGRSYPKETFAHVEELYRKLKKEQALQELCDITGLEKLEARVIIDNWHSYYFV